MKIPDLERPDRAYDEASAPPAARAEPRCSLCGDVAEPFTVRAIDAVTGMATAAGGECEVAVALDLVEDVAVGDTVLVHQGFAIARLDDGAAPA